MNAGTTGLMVGGILFAMIFAIVGMFLGGLGKSKSNRQKKTGARIGGLVALGLLILIRMGNFDASVIFSVAVALLFVLWRTTYAQTNEAPPES